MNQHASQHPARLARGVRTASLIAGSAFALLSAAGAPAIAQNAPPARPDAPRGGPPGGPGAAGAPRPIPRGVLGDVPMTAADSVVKGIVDRLDFDSYKALIKGLAAFGDREQGTERNARAVDWIEQQLRGWGYTTERVKYNYTPRGGGAPEPREQVYATKIGSTVPGEMYILGGHMDGRGGGEAVNDDASGTALVMEIARVLAQPGVQTARSVRFALWNNEETGLDGARAYVEQRAKLQGIEAPRGSGKYPEPRWLGMIQHDMMLWDHGNPVTWQQALDADVDIEFQLNSAKAAESAQLAVQLLNANRVFATDYPAAMSNSMSNTDSSPFMDLVPAVSLRENRRLYETGRGANPHWHRATDLYVSFSDADFRLGFNAAQTTLGAVARLVEARAAAK
ncbi:MAG TPA: M20/M25/M40 family metallo-hydrolase [Gemmatimonadaceae bacterium]|nr:M20/M25/M40 family metallo-hydrolase [Gemmatimonadaceae bacterium]